jgi:ribosomal protein S18 acetylase RimI-like enzyme
MAKTLPEVITWPDRPDIRLRLVDWPDAERMREWKNANKQFFFHQADITPEQQRGWFEGYLKRPDDHNYAVEEELDGKFEVVGLLACRKLDDVVDVYNVMRGRRLSKDKVGMGEALQRLCQEIAAHYSVPITCKVLGGNPAIGWYLHNGFVQVGTAPDHVTLRYEKGKA